MSTPGEDMRQALFQLADDLDAANQHVPQALTEQPNEQARETYLDMACMIAGIADFARTVAGGQTSE